MDRVHDHFKDHQNHEKESPYGFFQFVKKNTLKEIMKALDFLNTALLKSFPNSVRLFGRYPLENFLKGD
jgi:hypothetical protein